MSNSRWDRNTSSSQALLRLLLSAQILLKISIQKRKEQSLPFNLRAPTIHHDPTTFESWWNDGFLSDHKPNERYSHDFRNNSPNDFPNNIPNNIPNDFLNDFLN